MRRHRPTRADELEAHLSEGYRNEYGSCAKVSVRGFDAEKHYVVKLERGRSLHELGTKSKVAWTSGMKGIEPFRINLHGSRLLLEKFHAAFDEDGVWHLDHRRENRREVMRLMEERERIVAAKDGAVKRRTGKLLASQVVSVLPRSLGAPNPYLD